MSRESFNRMVGSKPANRPEVKEFPKPPAGLRSKDPARAKALDEWHRQIDEWRKSFIEGVTTTVLTSFQKEIVNNLNVDVQTLESQPQSSQLAMLNAYIIKAAKAARGKNEGFASLGKDGKVPLSQLPVFPDLLSSVDFDRVLTNGKEPIVDCFGNLTIYTY